MRKYMIMAMLLTMTSALAQQMSEQQARLAAEEFFEARTDAGMKARAVVGKKAKSPSPELYIFNREDGQGWVVVAADEGVAQPILAFSDEGTLDIDKVSPTTRFMLDGYADMIRQQRADGQLGKKPRRTVRRAEQQGVEPLLTTHWNQNPPYNNQCPAAQYGGKEGYGGRCPSGCVVVAVAQLMNYYRWPRQAVGSHNHYEMPLYRDFSQQPYDWDNMLDDYSDGNYTEAEGNAVAQLMADLGCAMNTLYGDAESGTYVSDIVPALAKHFGYEEHPLSWDDLTPTWDETHTHVGRMCQELDEGRPFLCEGYTSTATGMTPHETVCDGYMRKGDTDDDVWFHINFGWGGVADGYFNWYEYVPNLWEHWYAGFVNLEPDYAPIVRQGNVFCKVSGGEARVMTFIDGQKDAPISLDIPAEVTLDGRTYPVTDIYDRAFDNTWVSGISFPGTIKKLRAGLFGDGYMYAQSCPLRTVTFAEGLEEIEDDAFRRSGANFSQMPILTFTASLKRLGDTALRTAERVQFLGTGYVLGDYALSGVYYIDGLEGAAEIGTGAVNINGSYTMRPDCIYHPRAVTADEVVIPKGVAFSIGCTVDEYGLPQKTDYAIARKSYVVDPGHADLCSRDRVLYSKDKTELLRFPTDYDATWLTIPAGVRRVDRAATDEGTAIAYLTLPQALTDFDGAFQSGDLRQVTIMSATPPTLTDAATFNLNGSFRYGTPTLIVPVGSREAYSQAPVWREFADIREELTASGPLFFQQASNGVDANVVGRNTAVSFDGHLTIPATVSIGGKEADVRSVNIGAFAYDDALLTLSLSDKLWGIGGYPGLELSTCDNLRRISVADGNDDFHATDGMLIEMRFGHEPWLVCCPARLQTGAQPTAQDGLAVAIPDGVEQVEQYAFGRRLQKLTIPASVTRLQPNSLALAEDLHTVVCLSEEPPMAEDWYGWGDVFHPNVFLEEGGATLYVPQGCIGAYRSTAPWRDFPNIREISNGATVIQEVTTNQHPESVYDLQGRHIASDTSHRLPKGIYIVGGKKIMK